MKLIWECRNDFLCADHSSYDFDHTHTFCLGWNKKVDKFSDILCNLLFFIFSPFFGLLNPTVVACRKMAKIRRKKGTRVNFFNATVDGTCLN